MIMNWIVERLKEPSTWAGFAGLAGAIGIAEPLYAAVSAVGVAVAGLLAVILSEKSEG
jgi:hypothetical protein